MLTEGFKSMQAAILPLIAMKRLPVSSDANATGGQSRGSDYINIIADGEGGETGV